MRDKTDTRTQLADHCVSRRRFFGVGASLAMTAMLTHQPRQAKSGQLGNVRTPPNLARGLRDELRQELDKIRLIDAHEHLPREREWLDKGPDVVSLLGYARGDLVCAGMPKDALTPGMAAKEVWRTIAPFWPHVRNMGAGQLCRRTLSMFFEVDDLDESALPSIEEKLADLMKPGIYRNLLRERHNIDVCLNVENSQTIIDESSFDIFAPLLHTSRFAMVQKRSDIHQVERQSDLDIHSLESYLRAVDTVLDRVLAKGLVGLKWHLLAYLRDIHYASPDRQAAERCFNRILRMPARGGLTSDTPVGFNEMRPFQDLIQHHLVRWAIEHDLPVQIHTGILGGSYGAQITHTKPSHLTNLFLQYPKARFDLLHVSYPYMRELTAIAKLFPNVYINTAWFEVLSPRAARQFLREWITSVPTNKIIGFGADQLNVFLSCASAEVVKDNVAEVLTSEVVEGTMSEEQALEIANCLLRNNAWEYFRLEKRWENR